MPRGDIALIDQLYQDQGRNEINLSPRDSQDQSSNDINGQSNNAEVPISDDQQSHVIRRGIREKNFSIYCWLCYKIGRGDFYINIIHTYVLSTTTLLRYFRYITHYY